MIICQCCFKQLGLWYIELGRCHKKYLKMSKWSGKQAEIIDYRNFEDDRPNLGGKGDETVNLTILYYLRLLYSRLE